MQIKLYYFKSRRREKKDLKTSEMTDIERTFISDIITNGPKTTEINTIIETEINDKTCTNEQI